VDAESVGVPAERQAAQGCGVVGARSLTMGLRKSIAVLLVYLHGPLVLAGGPSTADYKKGDPHKFLNLRYDEDFRYFDEDREAYESDPRNRIKNIHLGEAWRLDLGGEFRVRVEARSNQTFGRTPRTQNTQQNYRWMLHANLRHGDLFRVFVQGIVAHVENPDGPFQPTQENHGDLQQLFFDWRFLGEQTPLTLRLGRQELEYGASRFVGPIEWVSTRRRFDAAKIYYEGDLWNIDAFYAKPVIVERVGGDNYNEDTDFYGLYSTYKGIDFHGIDLYFFALDDKGHSFNQNGRAGDRDIYTIGARFWGNTGGMREEVPPEDIDRRPQTACPTCGSGGSGTFDYNTELTGQWGHWAGDEIDAWSWALDLGYTFDHPWRPRIGTGIDMTSGDKDPFDRTVGSLNPLFPFNNVCIGFLDLMGRSNINTTYVGLDVWPVPDKVKASIFYHAFWLDAEQDAFYNAGGAGVLRDRTGRSGKQLGQELDLGIEWLISDYSSLWLAYSYFFTDNYIDTLVPGSDDPQLFLLQYQYKF
jgi:hypothetical protein